MKKITIKKNLSIASLLIFIVMALFTSCLDDGRYTIVLEGNDIAGIPADHLASENPSIGEPTTTIPNIQYTVEESGNDAIIRIDMTGIQEVDSYDWLRLVGTAENDQNVWLSIDGKPKGISVYNNSDNNGQQQISADLVFVVDNSGSMSEEADAIARDIVAWSQKLAASNLDIRFGCVGYDVNGKISGAINMCDVNSLNTYLNRTTGTGRTKGFSGTDAYTLENTASYYDYEVNDECGGLALRYADNCFNFRTGSNRIYVNFTDEPNQPNNNQEYSVEYFADQANWSTNQGTVHTVYSDTYTSFTEYQYEEEKPWRISEYTGGTTLFASSDFSGVTLENLPVTGAMTNSYIIRFTNVSEFMDGEPHVVKITILSTDGKTRAEKTFYMTF